MSICSIQPLISQGMRNLFCFMLRYFVLRNKQEIITNAIEKIIRLWLKLYNKDNNWKIGIVSLWAGSSASGRGKSDRLALPKRILKIIRAMGNVNAKRSGNTPQNTASFRFSGFLIFSFKILNTAHVQNI